MLPQSRVGVVGCGVVADHPKVQQILRDTFALTRPVVVLFPGHTRFNAMVRGLAARWGLSIEEIRPPRSTWLGKAPQSVRKGMARDFWGKYLAQRVETVIAFRAEGGTGRSFQPLLDHTSQWVCVRINRD